jgi:hypothetical protein
MSILVPRVDAALPEDGASLVGLAQVKTFLGIAPDDLSADDLLTDMILRGSEAVCGFLNHRVLSHDASEERDGTGSNRMMFGQWPVTAVQTVRVNGIAIAAQAGIGQPGYRFTPTMLVLDGYRFTRGWANVELAYTAGWAEVPADIAQAVIEVVALMYRRRDHIDVSSKSLAGETVSYITAEIPPSAKQALENYRHRIPTP